MVKDPIISKDLHTEPIHILSREVGVSGEREACVPVWEHRCVFLYVCVCVLPCAASPLQASLIRYEIFTNAAII